MEILQFIENYNLHDSTIERVHYMPKEQRCSIELELCNYMQPDYIDSYPELSRVMVSILDIREISSSLSLADLSQGLRIDGSILVSNVSLLENLPNECLKRWKLVFQFTKYDSCTDETAILSFKFKDVSAHYIAD